MSCGSSGTELVPGRAGLAFMQWRVTAAKAAETKMKQSLNRTNSAPTLKKSSTNETGAGQAAEGFGDKQRPQSCSSGDFERSCHASRNQYCRCKQRHLSSCKVFPWKFEVVEGWCGCWASVKTAATRTYVVRSKVTSAPQTCQPLSGIVSELTPGCLKEHLVCEL
ncbi:hypothetical protein AK812_SmicGene8746 [Symbiodinium microadriaticum]|uniref:Uncharacterized protein n=1 Tax=Symbiodinium microadriaticum TaxID=2951 RepID=A0A1Q9EKA7_SYMMI|nr:hypothetical protein AK812_SmicGene8746 [Symbiodinium microadriaticum]